ncbi:MAG: ankyrin repeat domain-containing protein, partial [Bryobacteraceae bacterium]
MVRDRQDVARYLIARGCGTDILMAAALGDLALVRKHLDADPDCVRMNVSEQYFPRRDPRSGGSIYIWTLGSNKTAHLIAREFGHESVYRLLMERSPDVLKLAHACELGEEATIQSLLAKRPGLVQTLAEDDRRKLAYAAQSNNTQAVRLMLAAGWPVEVRGQHGGTPLHWASWHGNVEMVRELLRHRAPVDIRGDDWNATPLGWALHGSENGWNCKAGDYAGAVEALLQAGAKAPPINEDLNASESVLEVLRRFAA